MIKIIYLGAYFLIERFGRKKYISKRENTFNELTKIAILLRGSILLFLLGVFRPLPDYFMQLMVVSIASAAFMPTKLLGLIYTNRKVDRYIKDAKQYSSKKKILYSLTYWLLLLLLLVLLLASLVFSAVSYRDN